MTVITSIELYHIAMPLLYPWRTAYGSDDVIESVIMRMNAGEMFGWGETTPLAMPTYSPEYTGGVYRVIRDILAPRLIGKEITSGEELQQQFFWIKGNFFAKGGLDAAWWDMEARRQGLPLWKLIGGTSPVIDVGADFGVQDSIDMLLGNIEKAVNTGFTRIKLKYCPGWDLDMIAAVRAAFPTMVFHIDCNSGYTLADAAMFKKLDRYELAMIEQPLMHDDLIDHAALQAQIETPVCLDESITSPEKTARAVKIGACRWVNIKPARVGGITRALRVNQICEEAGIPCWVGGMLESALGASVCKALASLANMKYPSDVFPSSRFYAEDLSRPSIALSGPSQMTLSDTPGVGAAPDPIRLERQTLDRVVIK
ncbi:MAG: o-succinylbenzoate synthase [candidate division Zixibacteria bacterium]|nr:o-succinylbenzoate synthase [candidate division Zixibacteria bacterium]